MTNRMRSLHETIESTVELAAHRISDKDVSLNCRIDPACRNVFAFNHWCMTQLVNNLLSNALQYTQSGSVKVDVDCDDSNGMANIRINITDTGPGISESVQKVMFASPDQRELMPDNENVGFGVIISQQLCEMMGAQLQVESKPGEGTSVTISGSIDRAKPEGSPSGTVTDAFRNTQALVIDTDLSARRLLEAHLRSWGIRVRSVLDVTSAIALVHEAAAREHSISMVFISQETAPDDVRSLIDELHRCSQHIDAMIVMTGSDITTSKMHLATGDRFGVTLGSPVRPSALFDCVAQHPYVQSQAQAGDDVEPPPVDADRERHVLLVEDNIVNQCVASEILKRIGVSVDIANNGREALDKLSVSTYDFVFMDCQMPEMDGFEATRRIRQRESLQSLPVVALTANALSGDRQSCLDAGMSDYLTKPFTRDQLETMLNKWTRGGTVVATKAPDGTSEFAAIQLVDDSALNEIRMLDVDGESSIFEEIISEYMMSSKALVRDIDAAVAAKAPDEVARCAHALKSSSAAVGLKFFADQCAELEKLGMAAQTDKIAELWPQAEHCFRRSVDCLAGTSKRRVA